MKKLMTLAFVFSLIASVLAGCGGPTPTQGRRMPGMIDTPDERLARTSMIEDCLDRGLTDDWDYFWLYDEQTNLSVWPTYVAP